MKSERRRVERQFLCSSPINLPKLEHSAQTYIIKDLESPLLVTLEGSEHRHLSQSLRLKIGENINLFDPNDQIKLHGTLIDICKDSSSVKCHSYSYYQGPDITVLVGLAEQKTIDFITEKLSELGINNIIYFKGEHSSNKGLNKTLNLNRLERIRDSAIKQSNSYVFTKINYFPDLISCANTIDNDSLNIALFPPEIGMPWRSLDSILSHDAINTKIRMAIGPEGGFSQNEMQYLMDNNYLVASLANNTLRVETAAILASGMILQKCYNSGN